jgi:hypothetical protein
MTVVDAAVLLREHPLAQISVTALLGTNRDGSIYAAADLPEHFDPKKGAVVQLMRAGGISNSEDLTQLINARIQLRVWADQEQYLLASDVYGAVRDQLHGVCNVSLDEGILLSALEVTGPQESTDPETGWVAINAFYTVLAVPPRQ